MCQFSAYNKKIKEYISLDCCEISFCSPNLSQKSEKKYSKLLISYEIIKPYLLSFDTQSMANNHSNWIINKFRIEATSE